MIVGGGLTGCACAWSFAAAGVKVVLLEADAIGGGATARGLGLVREDFDASFQETSALHGLRSARTLWQAMRRASLDFPAALRRLAVKCDLAPADLLIVRAPRRRRRPAAAARVPEPPRRGAGSQLGDAGRAGARDRRRGRRGDPDARRFARSVSRVRGVCRGGRRSRRRALRASLPSAGSAPAGSRSRSRPPRARVRADTVLVATGAPLADLRALRRHLKARHGYAVVTEPLPAAVRREVGRRAAALRDSDDAAAPAPLDARRPRDVFRGRPARSRAARERQGARPADRAVDVRAVDALSRDFRPSSPSGPGISRITKPWIACRLWACTAIFRAICSRWAPAATARALRGWLPGSCCASTREKPPGATSCSGSLGCL